MADTSEVRSIEEEKVAWARVSRNLSSSAFMCAFSVVSVSAFLASLL